MASSNFVDYVRIFFRSGNGGGGSTHLHRDIMTAKGGPDGGNGGRGSHIILRGNKQHWTLLPLKYHKHIYGEHGGSGSSGNKTGHDGADMYVDVPLGTVVRDGETFTLCSPLNKADRHAELARMAGGGAQGEAMARSLEV